MKDKKGKIIVIVILLLLVILYKNKYVINDYINLLKGNLVTAKVNYENINNLREESLEKEIEDLKKILNLNNTMSNYNFINSTIINRNSFDWLNKVSIDKGKKDGIVKDMGVINENGLVGRIIEVYNNTSVVELLSSNNDKYRLAISINNSVNGIITGYDKEKDLIIINCIRNSDNVNIGDIVKTSGLSTIMPEGILIGYVSEVEVDELGINKIVKVKSAVDFYNLKYISVLEKY